MADKKVKSAFELAMERLDKESGPTQKLNDEQKARIAEIEKMYAAKSAEVHLELDPQIAMANYEDLPGLKATLAAKLASLEEERESKKEKIWDE